MSCVDVDKAELNVWKLKLVPAKLGRDLGWRLGDRSLRSSMVSVTLDIAWLSGFALSVDMLSEGGC